VHISAAGWRARACERERERESEQSTAVEKPAGRPAGARRLMSAAWLARPMCACVIAMPRRRPAAREPLSAGNAGTRSAAPRRAGLGALANLSRSRPRSRPTSMARERERASVERGSDDGSVLSRRRACDISSARASALSPRIRISLLRNMRTFAALRGATSAAFGRV
jgi:hypothetical protein